MTLFNHLIKAVSKQELQEKLTSLERVNLVFDILQSVVAIDTIPGYDLLPAVEYDQAFVDVMEQLDERNTAIRLFILNAINNFDNFEK